MTDTCGPCDKPLIEPKPLQFDGTPVWAWVGCYDTAWKNEYRRQVVAGSESLGFAAIFLGDNLNSVDTANWGYAWEIPE